MPNWHRVSSKCMHTHTDTHPSEGPALNPATPAMSGPTAQGRGFSTSPCWLNTECKPYTHSATLLAQLPGDLPTRHPMSLWRDVVSGPLMLMGKTQSTFPASAGTLSLEGVPCGPRKFHFMVEMTSQGVIPALNTLSIKVPAPT